MLSALSTPLTLPRLELDEDDDGDDVADDDDGDDTGDGGDDDDDDDDDEDTGDGGVDRQLVRMGYRFLVRGCKGLQVFIDFL